MKISVIMFFWLVFIDTVKAGIEFAVPPPLDRVKLEEILKQVDHASVSFHLPSLHLDRDKASYVTPSNDTGIVTDDKEWLNEFSTFLKTVDGTPEWITPAMTSDISMVALCHGDKALMNLMWADDERLIIYAPDGSWSVELKIDEKVLKQYQAICAKKKPSVELELKQRSQPLKVPLLKIDPESLKIQLPNKPAQPTPSAATRQPG